MYDLIQVRSVANSVKVMELENEESPAYRQEPLTPEQAMILLLSHPAPKNSTYCLYPECGCHSSIIHPVNLHMV